MSETKSPPPVVVDSPSVDNSANVLAPPSATPSTAPSSSRPVPPSSVAEFLEALPTHLEATKTEDDITTWPLPKGVVVESPGSSRFNVVFPEVDAAWFIAAWKLEGARAVSGDVHQRSWHIALFDGDVPDRYNKRISTRSITVGAWVVRPQLKARPEGPLPGVVAGASPAYDLAKAPAQVVSISIQLGPVTK